MRSANKTGRHSPKTGRHSPSTGENWYGTTEEECDADEGPGYHGAPSDTVGLLNHNHSNSDSDSDSGKGWVRSAESKKTMKTLLTASALCLIFMVLEIAGGLISGSLAILTDAAHMLSDFASFLISLAAVYVSEMPASKRLSFGFHRLEILGALTSVLIIWVLSGILIYEAVLRIINPEVVNAKVMFGTACFGVFVNIAMGVILYQGGHGHSHGGLGDDGHGHGHSHSDEEAGHNHDGPKKEGNMNVRAAFIHVLGDLVQSVGVLIASIIIWVKPEWTIADPICTFVFSIIVLATTAKIVWDAAMVLMEAAPKNIDPDALRRDLEGIPKVERVRDLHVWSITVGKGAVAGHIEVEDDDGTILPSAKKIACQKYALHHSTFQIESRHQRQMMARMMSGPVDCSLTCEGGCNIGMEQISGASDSCEEASSLPSPERN
eukprot:Clim_evm5s80 gene=Clim_evmTU5s80